MVRKILGNKRTQNCHSNKIFFTYAFQLINSQKQIVQYQITIQFIRNLPYKTGHHQFTSLQMCLTFFRIFTSPSHYQFVLCFNRQQAYLRQTLPFGSFSQDTNIYAGRDSVSGGTWLGMNIKTGLIVILTNYDDTEIKILKSRGQMVYKFLATKTYESCKNQNDVDQRVLEVLRQIESTQHEYSPFNICIYNIRTNKIVYLNNKTNSKIRSLETGINYGLCNIDIDTVWEKTAHGLSIFKDIAAKLTGEDYQEIEDTIQQMQKLMRNDQLFQTDREKQASIFVHPYYSKLLKHQRMTKSTTFILVNKEKGIHVKELSYGREKGDVPRVVDAKLELLDL